MGTLKFSEQEFNETFDKIYKNGYASGYEDGLIEGYAQAIASIQKNVLEASDHSENPETFLSNFNYRFEKLKA